MQDHDFLFDAPAFEITKTYRDDNGQMFVEGIASTVDIDLTDERMAPEAIAKMATRAIGLPLRSEHGKGWDDKLGEIVQADVIKDDQGRPALWIKAKLFDWSSKAKDLFSLLKSGSRMGLSVAGKIRPGGLVKELSESLGKYVPTYKDVDLTEVSVTDHPANLGTWAVAVAKSFNEQTNHAADYTDAGTTTSTSTGEVSDMKKDVTNANESKPKEYSDVATSDFLDPEHYKYPVDDKHLMPALRYFNQSGQRSDGGYSTSQWAEMGHKLAGKLSAKTGEHYEYDSSSETVKKPTTEKTSREEVNDMNKQSNLVSKQVNPAVASFAKEWGRDLSKEITVEKADSDSTTSTTSSTPSSVEMAAPSSTSTGSSTGTGSTSTGTGSSDKTSTDKDFSITISHDSSSDESSTGSTDTGSLESLLDSIMSSLSTLSSSLSSTDSSDSDSSTSTGSNTDTTGSSTDSTGTTGSSSDGSTSSYDDAITSLSRALESLKALQKGKSSTGTTGSTDTGHSSTPTSTTSHGSSSTPTSTGSTSTTGVTELGKAMLQMTDVMAEIKKSVDGLVEKVETQPRARKGYAVLMEKRFDGHTDVQEIDQRMVAKFTADPEVTYNELHAYRTYGVVPGKYANATE